MAAGSEDNQIINTDNADKANEKEAEKALGGEQRAESVKENSEKSDSGSEEKNQEKSENSKKSVCSGKKERQIDWLSAVLVFMVLANVAYWLLIQEYSITNYAPVFLARPAENKFQRVSNRSDLNRGVIPPAPADNQAAEHFLYEDNANVENDRRRNVKYGKIIHDPSNKHSRAESSAFYKEENKGAEELQRKEEPASAVPYSDISSNTVKISSIPEVQELKASEAAERQKAAEKDKAALEVYLSVENACSGRFKADSQIFRGKLLDMVSVNEDNTIPDEVKRDFLVNQYMFAAEVLDSYGTDNSKIFECDVQCQRFAVTGDFQSEISCINEGIKLSRSLLKETLNRELQKALKNSKADDKTKKAALEESRNAEKLLNYNFNSAVNEYEKSIMKLAAASK